MFKILDTKKYILGFIGYLKIALKSNTKNILELVCFIIDFHQILVKIFNKNIRLPI